MICSGSCDSCSEQALSTRQTGDRPSLRPCLTCLDGRFLKRPRLSCEDPLQTEAVVDSYSDFLLRPEVTLGRLDGAVPEEELDLLQVSACFAAELCAGAAKIVDAETLDADLLG